MEFTEGNKLFVILILKKDQKPGYTRCLYLEQQEHKIKQKTENTKLIISQRIQGILDPLNRKCHRWWSPFIKSPQQIIPLQFPHTWLHSLKATSIKLSPKTPYETQGSCLPNPTNPIPFYSPTPTCKQIIHCPRDTKDTKQHRLLPSHMIM